MLVKWFGSRSGRASVINDLPIWALYIEIISLVALLIATALAVFEYFNYRYDQTVESSLRILQSYNDSNLSEARFLFFEPWQRIEVKSLLQAAENDEIYGQIIAKTVEAEILTAGSKFQRALHSIVDFYDSAHACVESAVCNDKFLYENIGRYAIDFFCLYRHPYISDVRSTIGVGDQGFATGLEKFVRGTYEFFADESAPRANQFDSDHICEAFIRGEE